MERNDVTVTGNIPTSNIIIPEDIITKLRDEIIENLKSLFEKELSDIKDFYISELAKRDNGIYKLQTRIGELQRRVALAEIFCDKQKIDIDDNEQYSRRHSLHSFIHSFIHIFHSIKKYFTNTTNTNKQIYIY